MKTKKYKEAVCRGSFELGSACGHCERCADELKERQKKNPKKKLVAKKVDDGKLWTIWDNENKDYAFTILLEVPVFKNKNACSEIVTIWNEQAALEGKKRKYRMIEALLTPKDAQKYKK